MLGIKVRLALSALLPAVPLCLTVPVYAAPSSAAPTARELYLSTTFVEQNAATTVALSRQYSGKISSLNSKIAKQRAALNTAAKEKTEALAQVEAVKRQRGKDKQAAEKAQKEAHAKVEAANARAEAAETKYAELLGQRQEELAANDTTYAQTRAILNSVSSELTQTPEGKRALELYLVGGRGSYQAADLILEKETRARSAAIDAEANKKKAADARNRAYLARDALEKGRTTTAHVADLFEKVVAFDPSGYFDWVALGDARLKLHQTDEALEAANRAVEAASSVDSQRALSLRFLGLVLFERHDIPAAKKAYEEALTINRKFAENNQSLMAPIGPTADPEIFLIAGKEFRQMPDTFRSDQEVSQTGELAYTLSSYAEALKQQNDIPAAIKVATEAYDLANHNLKARPTSEYAQVAFATHAIVLGDIHKFSQNLPLALDKFNEALSIVRDVVSMHPETLAYKINIGALISRIADIQMSNGNIDAAGQFYQESLRIGLEHIDSDPASSLAKGNHAVGLGKMGEFYLAKKDFGKALDYFSQALALRQVHVEAEPGGFDAKHGLANTMLDMGGAHEAIGDLRVARTWYEKALKLARTMVLNSNGADYDLLYVGLCLSSIGLLLVDNQKVAEALPYLQESTRIKRELLAANPSSPNAQLDLMVNLGTYGNAQRQMRKLANAQSSHSEAFSLAKYLPLSASPFPNSVSAVIDNLLFLAQDFFARGDLATAKTNMEMSLFLSRKLATSLPSKIKYRGQLGDVLEFKSQIETKKGELEQALVSLQEALTLDQQTLVTGLSALIAKRNVAILLNRNGQILAKLMRLSEARAKLTESLSIRRELAARSPKSVEANTDLTFGLMMLAELQVTMGDRTDAISTFEELLALPQIQDPASFNSKLSAMRQIVALAYLVALDAPGHSQTELTMQMRALKSKGQLGHVELDALKQIKSQVNALSSASAAPLPRPGKH